MKVSLVSMLLATTFLSTNAVAYTIEPTIEDGVISYVKGTADDYNFTIQEADDSGKLTTKYYKININKSKFTNSSAISWTVLTNKPADMSNVIEIKLPNNDVRYFQYRYTTPSGYTNATRIDNTLDSSDLTNKVFKDLTSTSSGGAIYNNDYNRDINISNDFIGNNVINTSSYAYGGAIFNEYNSAIGNITENFIGNYATSSSDSANGGAIYNYGSIGNITGDFIGNYVTSTSYNAYGGAIFNEYNSAIGDITSNFIGNYATSTSSDAYGGAIYNHGGVSIPAIIGNITGDFIGNYASTSASSSLTYAKGGAIYNMNGNIGDITGNFIDNYAGGSYAYGGAIFNDGGVDDITGDFSGNYTTSSIYTAGGGLHNSGSINDITGNFIGNYATSVNSSASANGGAIYNTGTIDNIDGNFIANFTNAGHTHGGAIYNNNGTIGDITGDFIGNYVTSSSTYANGGAIYNYGGTIGNITGDFIGNYASGSYAYGGAIYNNNYDSTTTIGNITGDFIGNYATSTSSDAYGGAIYNNSNDSTATIGNITGDFTGNYVTSTSSSDSANGGAIYNTGTIRDITSDFIGNFASGAYTSGGAIYNTGITGAISGNFTDNYATSTSYSAEGGAIYNIGTTGAISGNFTDNYATSTSYSAKGGAIYNTGIIDNIDGNFSNNKATSSNEVYGGAIYNEDTINTITGNFDDNSIESSSSYAFGGAVYSGGSSSSKISGNFSNNSASAKQTAYGGAIHNYTSKTISGDFSNNHVESTSANAYGGAIYNAAPSSDITGSFINNYAKSAVSAYGGAIYSNEDITLFAKSNGSSVIKGNYVEDQSGIRAEAIFMDNATTLTLVTLDKGTINLYDIINGDNYNVVMNGDRTGSVSLFNDVNNASITVANTSVNLSNNETKNYTFNSLRSLSSAKWNIDVDLENEMADSITTTNASSGTVYIDKINNFGYNDNEDGITIQILKNQHPRSSLQLALNNANFIIKNNTSNIDDTVYFSKTYIKEWGVTIATTDTTNDSIKIAKDGIFDSLALINSKETANERSFIFDISGTSSLSENLSPTTEGTLNIIGFNNSAENSTINAKGHSLFNLSNATTLNIEGVTLSNASDNAISISSDEAKLNLTDVIMKNNGGDAINVSSQAEINLTNVLFENNGGNAITSSGNVSINVKDTDIEMNENIVMNDAKLSLYAENGTLDLSNQISGSNYDLHIKGGNINVSNSVSGVNNLKMSSSAVLHLGKESNISVVNMMPLDLQSKTSPTLELDVDIVNNHITNGTIDVSEDISGTYNLIINNLSTEYTANSSVFLTALNDDSSTATKFNVSRVKGNPYMWKAILNAEGETTGSTWYLATTEQFSPEVIAGIGLQSAGIEQTRSIVHNVSNKAANQHANKNKLVYNKPHRNQWGWTIIDKKGKWSIDQKVPQTPQDNVWVFAQGEYANIDTPVDMEAQIWGVEGGFNLQSNANNTLGIFASYRNGTYDLSGAGAEFNAKLTSEIGIDSYLGGLYYRYDNSKFYAFATLYGGMQQAEITTEDSFASFETDGMEFGASAEIGYSFALSRTATLTPSLGVFYSQVSFDEAEDNVGKTYEWDDVSNIEAELGLNFAQNIGRSKVYIKPSVIQTFVNGNEVMITGLEAVETADNQTLGRIEIGGRLGITDNLYGYGWANYTFSSDYNSASLGAELNYSW